MGKNKLKYVLFFIATFFFCVFAGSGVKASDYNVGVTNVTGINYGDKLSECHIEGTSSIEGVFSFYQPNKIINTIGEVNLDIIFTPYDLETYQPKKIEVIATSFPRAIFIVFDTPIYKQYDGSTSINLPNYHYEGIIDNEVSIVGNLQASLAGSYVGEGITINLSGVEIEGERKNFYALDLLNHKARIYPSYLEKNGEFATKIELDKNIYVDISYSLKVKEEEVDNVVNEKYTSFLKYSYFVYDHHNNLLNIDSNFKVTMDLDENVIKRERLTVYELTSDGTYKEIGYSYSKGKITFNIDSDSSIVFATRDIEWNLINLFVMILIFSCFFVIIYRFKNSKIKGNKGY